jgi:Bacterial TniB protein
VFEIVTAIVDEKFDVRQRLVQVSEWKEEWLCEDDRLKARLRLLSPKKLLDIQRGDQIGIFRKRLKMRLIREPLEIAAEPESGYKNIRQNLVEQFASLPKEMKLLWLDNFVFIMTPDLWELHEKVKDVLDYQSLGQQRNFLLGAPSGMGKSTYLNWLSALHLPVVEESRNFVPVIKIDAPVSNKTPRALLQRLILECGLTYLQGDTEENLNQKLGLYFQQCGVVLIIIDEVEHISHPEMKRRVLDLSNRTQGVPFICASCNPTTWVMGDEEVAGRWNDFFELPPYRGERLSRLLASLELLLPFTQPSNLALPVIKEKSGEVDGPAKFIELMTGGILRDIMILIRDASRRAIEADLPCLTPGLLQTTWKKVQRQKATDFLDLSGMA